MARALVARLHNPRGARCGCPPECICQRNAVGRLLRWYLPPKYHTPLAPAEKRRRAAADGLDFR